MGKNRDEWKASVAKIPVQPESLGIDKDERLIKQIEEMGYTEDISYQYDLDDGEVIRFCINKKRLPELISVIRNAG